jgi:hypothetical protein
MLINNVPHRAMRQLMALLLVLALGTRVPG